MKKSLAEQETALVLAAPGEDHDEADFFNKTPLHKKIAGATEKHYESSVFNAFIANHVVPDNSRHIDLHNEIQWFEKYAKTIGSSERDGGGHGGFISRKQQHFPPQFEKWWDSWHDRHTTTFEVDEDAGERTTTDRKPTSRQRAATEETEFSVATSSSGGSEVGSETEVDAGEEDEEEKRFGRGGSAEKVRTGSATAFSPATKRRRLNAAFGDGRNGYGGEVDDVNAAAEVQNYDLVQLDQRLAKPLTKKGKKKRRYFASLGSYNAGAVAPGSRGNGLNNHLPETRLKNLFEPFEAQLPHVLFCRITGEHSLLPSDHQMQPLQGLHIMSPFDTIDPNTLRLSGASMISDLKLSDVLICRDSSTSSYAQAVALHIQTATVFWLEQCLLKRKCFSVNADKRRFAVHGFAKAHVAWRKRYLEGFVFLLEDHLMEKESDKLRMQYMIWHGGGNCTTYPDDPGITHVVVHPTAPPFVRRRVGSRYTTGDEDEDVSFVSTMWVEDCFYQEGYLPEIKALNVRTELDFKMEQQHGVLLPDPGKNDIQPIMNEDGSTAFFGGSLPPGAAVPTKPIFLQKNSTASIFGDPSNGGAPGQLLQQQHGGGAANNATGLFSAGGLFPAGSGASNSAMFGASRSSSDQNYLQQNTTMTNLFNANLHQHNAPSTPANSVVSSGSQEQREFPKSGYLKLEKSALDPNISHCFENKLLAISSDGTKVGDQRMKKVGTTALKRGGALCFGDEVYKREKEIDYFVLDHGVKLSEAFPHLKRREELRTDRVVSLIWVAFSARQGRLMIPVINKWYPMWNPCRERFCNSLLNNPDVHTEADPRVFTLHFFGLNRKSDPEAAYLKVLAHELGAKSDNKWQEVSHIVVGKDVLERCNGFKMKIPEKLAVAFNSGVRIGHKDPELSNVNKDSGKFWKYLEKLDVGDAKEYSQLVQQQTQGYLSLAGGSCKNGGAAAASSSSNKTQTGNPAAAVTDSQYLQSLNTQQKNNEERMQESFSVLDQSTMAFFPKTQKIPDGSNKEGQNHDPSQVDQLPVVAASTSALVAGSAAAKENSLPASGITNSAPSYNSLILDAKDKPSADFLFVEKIFEYLQRGKPVVGFGWLCDVYAGAKFKSPKEYEVFHTLDDVDEETKNVKILEYNPHEKQWYLVLKPKEQNRDNWWPLSMTVRSLAASRSHASRKLQQMNNGKNKTPSNASDNARLQMHSRTRSQFVGQAFKISPTAVLRYYNDQRLDLLQFLSQDLKTVIVQDDDRELIRENGKKILHLASADYDDPETLLKLWPECEPVVNITTQQAKQLQQYCERNVEQAKHIPRGVVDLKWLMECDKQKRILPIDHFLLFQKSEEESYRDGLKSMQINDEPIRYTQEEDQVDVIWYQEPLFKPEDDDDLTAEELRRERARKWHAEGVAWKEKRLKELKNAGGGGVGAGEATSSTSGAMRNKK
ncbi:unnamed protein product [Amoebophrya sp. A120]|nr:unnamed protein product [Amoebophrya sp. A120]|eukprot:GSA120T00008930001.1